MSNSPGNSKRRFSTTVHRCAPFVVLAGLIVVAAWPGMAVTEPQDDAAKVRLPKDALFADVKDKEPLATIDSNFLEYSAYKLVFQHAKSLTAELLSMHAKRVASYADLTGEARSGHQRELLHVEGKLVRIRERVGEGRNVLGGNDDASIYEGWLQFDSDPQSLVCIQFTRLPEDMKVGDKLNYRVVFDGYYFKLMSYQSSDKEGKAVTRFAPLLIGLEPAPIPTDPDAQSFEQVQLPKTGINYKAIESGKPMASIIDNRDEWEAYRAILAHASRTPLRALQRHGRPNVSFPEMRDKGFEEFLLQLLQIKGRMIDIQRVELPEPLKGTNIKEVYEGWMYHEGTPGASIKFVVTELPKGFKLEEAKDDAIVIEGYYFKLASFAGEKMGDGPAPRYAPVLIGRSFRVRDIEAPPPVAAQSERDEVELPPSDFYAGVKDRVPLASMLGNFDEYMAYNSVFSHLRKVTPEQMAKYSRRDIVYADLINDIRREYLRKLIHVEGRLVRLRERNASEYLRHSDTEVIYDAWLYFENQRESPINIAFTQLPEGMEVGERLNYQVSVDGYYFKLMAYESNEKDEKGKKVWRVAPLLVAIKPNLLTSNRDGWSWSGIAPLIMGVVGIVMLAAIGMAIWFRRGDRRTREKVRETMLTKNPFDESQGPIAGPVVQPGSAWEHIG